MTVSNTKVFEYSTVRPSVRCVPGVPVVPGAPSAPSVPGVPTVV